MAIADFAAGVQGVLRQRMEDALKRQQIEAQIAAEQDVARRGQRGLDLQERRLDQDWDLANRPEPEEPEKPVIVGGRLVMPSSGHVVFEPPPEPEKPTLLSPGAALAQGGRIILRNPTAPAKPDRSMDDVLAEYEAKKKIDAQYTGSRPSLGTERQTLAYFNRAKQASDDISELENVIANQGLMGQLQGQYAPNVFQNEKQQLYRQGQRAFTEARLRKESGAAIPQGEYDNDARTYFAQPGDSPAVIEQKRQARQVVLEGLKNAAGRAYEEFHGEPNTPSPQAPASSGPQATSTKPIRQRNARTGQIRISHDGGKTWQIP
jgi:hypothetical protein